MATLRLHDDSSSDVQKYRRVLQDVAESGATIGLVFNQPLKRYPVTMRSQISRAIHTHANPLATLKKWAREHKKAGGTVEQAMLLVTDLEAFIEALHADADCSDSAIRKASRLESEIEAIAENLPQMDLHENVTRTTLRAVRDGALQDIAHTKALLVLTTRRLEIEL